MTNSYKLRETNKKYKGVIKSSRDGQGRTFHLLYAKKPCRFSSQTANQRRKMDEWKLNYEHASRMLLDDFLRFI